MSYKSYLKTYYVFWISVLTLNAVIYLVYKNQKAFMLYFIITLLFAIIINGYEGHRISNYLKKYNNEQYTKNRSLNGINGVYNGLNAFAYLFSTSDLDDKTIISLKSNYKKVILLILFIFFSYPILLFLWV